MRFNKIAAIDAVGLTGPARKDIFALSIQPPAISHDDPKDEGEIIRRIGNADCVLVSWRTRITAEALRACPSVKYIGMCCTLYDENSANVDLAAARELGITVKGVRDYGDPGTLEFIISELICLFKGSGKKMWAYAPTELTSKTIGIIGAGVLGKMLARAALLFGARVLYFSRTRKPDLEAEGAEYLELDAMLPLCDVVSVHLPRNNCVLREAQFKLMRSNAVFVNTSLGEPFERGPFLRWLGEQTGNYAIFDLPGAGELFDELAQRPNVILYPVSSGFTQEATLRLTEKALANMREFLGGES